MPTLLVAETKVRFEFAMSDFNLPTLPSPKEELFHRNRENPLTGIIQLCIDQKRKRFTASSLVALATNNDEKERAFSGTFAQKRASRFYL